MSKTKQRGLSSECIKDLKDGILHPLLERLQTDMTLDLNIRDDYFNIYYRGGSLFRVKRAVDKGYQFHFEPKYFFATQSPAVALPNANVRRESEVMKWMEMIPLLKDTMDLWFGQHPKDERFLQQVVAWENNSSGWAGGTDYFVIDIEYDNRQGARFDIVALRWHSTAAARKLSRGYQPRLTIIEVKAGDGAVKDKSGLRDHLKQSAKFLADRAIIVKFRSEMLRVFEQKRELQLIRSLLKNKHKIEQVDHDIDEALLIIGHDPDSTKLDKELNEVKKYRGAVLVCHVNHAGFGLYADNMKPL